MHGHAAALKALLACMGYARHDGAWTHSERTAVFVGDPVDRGPEVGGPTGIVMDMIEVDAARAVMDDFNTVCLTMPDPQRRGEFLRPNTAKNLHQSAATHTEMERDPAQAQLVCGFMRCLRFGSNSTGYASPMRMGHAPWERSRHSSTPVVRLQTKVSCARPAIQCVRRTVVVNGIEANLPGGVWLAWRKAAARTALIDKDLCPSLSETPLPPRLLETFEEDRARYSSATNGCVRRLRPSPWFAVSMPPSPGA